MERVVVTGVGFVSCLGHQNDSISEALRQGRSGLGVDLERLERGFRSPYTGIVSGYDAADYVGRKTLKSMGEPARFGVGAAYRALACAELPAECLKSSGAGVIVGNDSCAEASVTVADTVRAHNNTRPVGSGGIIQVMTSTVSMNLATHFGIQGANWTVGGACASGAHAIGQSTLLIRSGMQELILCGGTQELGWQGMASFDAIGAFARPESRAIREGAIPSADEAIRASRPFDSQRGGLVPSGGGAMMVLESLTHARRRGAPILAEICGYGFSSDGQHLTQPNGSGAVRSMTHALKDAGLNASQVDYINAHATGTPLGDGVEGKAILEVFAAHSWGASSSPPVSSTKSLTGHECWMAGASELGYTILMMRDGFIAGNRNLENLDADLEGLQVLRRSREQHIDIALSNSFGFGGTNASIVLGRLGPHSVADGHRPIPCQP